ncbi:hypothetical protein [Steroidobacter cummioxidans]|uniref:hypothetical protein n=1 Tax=Steroidobacter cummioxidans TaxID=1803913 RepID=UPI000E30BA37|nr:hypothetical protein [Steroidobacter cummioxidans]
MQTRDWAAWIDRMPPPPDGFHVVGEVELGNPGMVAQLVYRQPQGINPTILLLDLEVEQRPGTWPDKIEWVKVRYDVTVTPQMPHYGSVTVFANSQLIAEMPVTETH